MKSHLLISAALLVFLLRPCDGFDDLRDLAQRSLGCPVVARGRDHLGFTESASCRDHPDQKYSVRSILTEAMEEELKKRGCSVESTPLQPARSPSTSRLQPPRSPSTSCVCPAQPACPEQPVHTASVAIGDYTLVSL